MGLLSQGSPLKWEETKKYADHVRKHGIIQFLNIHNKVKERQKDVLKWGDEVRNELFCFCLQGNSLPKINAVCVCLLMCRPWWLCMMQYCHFLKYSLSFSSPGVFTITAGKKKKHLAHVNLQL